MLGCLPFVGEEEMVELGLHLAAEGLATVVAGTVGHHQMTGTNRLAHRRVSRVYMTGG